jgi:hypothetical protein
MKRTHLAGPTAFLLGWILSFLLLLAGCGGAPPKQTELMKTLDQVDISRQELTVRMTSFVIQAAVRQEAGADSIFHGTASPEIRRNALLWKMNGISTLLLTGLLADPMASLIDTWAFCTQMRQFLAEGAGADLFGERQRVAVRVARSLESDIEAIARITVTGDPTRAKEFIATWVRDHPLRSLDLERVSTSTYWAEYLGQVQGGISSVGSMEESLNALLVRLNIYMTVLPKLSRWQAEVFYQESLSGPEIRAFLDNVDRIEAEIDSIAGIFLSAERLVEEGAAGTLAEARVLSERLMVQFRTEVEQLIARERDATFAEMRDEIAAILERLDAFTTRQIDTSTAGANDVIDHLFWRMVQLIVLAVVLVTAAVFITRIGRRPPPPAPKT